MTSSANRRTLLGGAALGILSAFTAASPAQASCTVTASTVVCLATTTSTTNTTNVGGSPAVDRNYPVDTSAAPFTGTVLSGAVVDNYGLAFTNTVGGTNALNVVNNGAVQVNVGNTASAGGSAAFNITAIGATSVDYSGAGNVTNLGTTGNGLEFDMTGSGALNATVGGNITSAVGGVVNGNGILVTNSGTGLVNLTTATGGTIRADYVGVWINATNTANAAAQTLTNNVTIASLTGLPGTLNFGAAITNSGLGATTLVNNGTVGSATDRTISVGVDASISNALSAAALSVTGSGAVFSAGNGLRAVNDGTGTTTVNYTGPVNTSGAGGVFTLALGGGATSITTAAVTAAADAIVANSTSGTQAITANGVTTGTTGSGIVSSTTGVRTITVGTAGNVTGGAQAILLNNTGGGSITNSGIIGAAATGLAINAAAATAPVTVTNNATGTINGRLTLGAGADTVTNNGIFNTQGTTDFGAGADALTNNSAGVINILGATTFANLETLNQNGRINLNANTLTLAATPFVNGSTGFIDTSGNASILGITSFSNVGTLDLAAGTFTVPAVVFSNSGTILADEGATTITGQTAFNNSGLINLQDGATGDFLTINSNYVGSGLAALNIDSSLTASDRLIVNFDASGSTRVNANMIGAGLINIPGNLVVDNVTSTPSAFVLGTVNGNTSPLVNYALVQNGADYYLTASPTAAAFDPMAVGNLASSIWYQSADEVQNQTDLPAVTVGASFWGQVYYSHDRFGDRNDTVVLQGTTYTVDNRVKTRRMGIQGGVDYGFGGARVGLTGGYGEAKSRNDLSSRFKATGWNAGLYGQFGGPIGFHGSALVKHDSYKLRFTDGAFLGERARLRADGIDGSLGYRFGMGGDAILDAKVGLSHVRTKVGNIDAFGFNYDYGRIKSTRGRAGLRATFAGELAPYIDASIHHEFDGQRNLRLFDGANSYDLDSQGKGTWGRIEAGLTGRDGPGPILALWADVGDKRGFGARAGFRFGGRAAEMVAPPAPMAPPPPPPPPPATQTCLDGSVILATDMCPPPPPPPPPPAAPLPSGERG